MTPAQQDAEDVLTTAAKQNSPPAEMAIVITVDAKGQVQTRWSQGNLVTVTGALALANHSIMTLHQPKDL